MSSFQFTSELTLAYIGPGAGITFLGSFFILFAALGLLLLSILTWPIRFAFLWLKRRRLHLKPLASRVVIIGLDGLDPGRVRRLMADGKLPNFQQLADSGAISDLASTLPPISPVAWSSFQTGVNPGKHNIFDFLNRDLRTYLPELSSARIIEGTAHGWRKWFGGGATVRLLRKSQPFWKLLGDCGIFSTILRVPITFPPERFFGLSLSAMCTPDLRGTQGSFTLFTTDPDEAKATTGGIRVHVSRTGNRIDCALPGPPRPNGQTPPDYRSLLRIRIFEDRQQIEIRAGKEKLMVPLQRESQWLRVDFRVGWFTNVSGIVRFRLESLQPHFRLYVSPIHLDPERPAMPISHPLYFSMYLAKLHDSFGTLGLAEDTWGLNSGVVGEEAFLEQAWAIHDERERMLFDSLRRMQRGLTVCVFDGPDRIQHMFSRYDIADHPANKGRDTIKHRTVIDDMYVRMDDLIGRVMQEIKGNDFLFVLSDHGFCDFSRGVNLNVWLRDNGYLVAKSDLLQEARRASEGTMNERPSLARRASSPESVTSPSPPAPLPPGERGESAGSTLDIDLEAGDYFADVDWSRTKAYAFGLSGIYINQQGREGQGIVPAKDAAALRAEIVQKMTGLRDANCNRRAVFKVHDCHQEYTGPYVSNGPDLIVGYERGYRASWENAVGRIDGPLFRDNDRPWSGDHCVDPAHVPGVLLMNRRLPEGLSPNILDFAPTILRLFGVPLPAYFDGKPWELSKAEDVQPQISQMHADLEKASMKTESVP